MKCPKCNQEIEDGSVFCEHCGEKITQPSNQPFTEEKGTSFNKEQTPTKRPKKRKIILLICIAIVLIAIVFFIILLSNMNSVAYEESKDSLQYIEQVEESALPTKPVLSESEKQALLNIGYVDLGLPSGTLWKNQNEDGFYSYNDAVFRFGSDFMPTKADIEELKTFCKWEHGGEYGGTSGSSIYYKVTGPSGNYIIMQTAGIKEPNNSIYMEGFRGFIYASSPDDEYEYYALVFSRDKIDGVESDYISVFPCRDDGYQYSVRLAR